MEGSLYTLTWQCQVACAEDSFILTRELQMGWGSVHGEAGPEDSRRRSKCKSYGVPVRPHAGHRAFLCSLPPDLEEPESIGTKEPPTHGGREETLWHLPSHLPGSCLPAKAWCRERHLTEESKCDFQCFLVI